MDVQRPSQTEYWVRRVLVLIAFFVLVTGIFTLARNFIDAVGNKLNPAPAASNTQSIKVSKQPVHACYDSDIRISLSVDSSEVPVNTPVNIRADFTNTSNLRCLRDVGATANEVYVTNANGDQVWSSNDCPAKAKVHLVKMQPGAVFRISTSWPGTFKPAKCGDVANPVPAGTYSVYARNAHSLSEPAAITVK